MSSTEHKPADKIFREGLLEVRIFADIRDMGAASAEELVSGGTWQFKNGHRAVEIPGETVFVLSFPQLTK